MTGMIGKRLEAALRNRFSPTHLAVRDDSHKHAGHAGSRPEGETHFHVTVISQQFAGQSRVARHRAVMESAKPLMEEGLHALQIIAYTPEEYPG